MKCIQQPPLRHIYIQRGHDWLERNNHCSQKNIIDCVIKPIILSCNHISSHCTNNGNYNYRNYCCKKAVLQCQTKIGGFNRIGEIFPMYFFRPCQSICHQLRLWFYRINHCYIKRTDYQKCYCNFQNRRNPSFYFSHYNSTSLARSAFESKVLQRKIASVNTIAMAWPYPALLYTNRLL